MPAAEAELTALQEVITVTGLPMFILVFTMIFALYRGLSHEEIIQITIGREPKAKE